MEPRFHRLLITAFEKRQRADYLADTGLDEADVDQLIEDVSASQRAAVAWLEQTDAEGVDRIVPDPG